MAVLDTDIGFGIVLYKEDLLSCDAFQTLSGSIEKYKPEERVAVVVFDNTPRKEDRKKNENFCYNEYVEVFYFTENENRGLPYAYNLFAEKLEQLSKNWMVLLDQDTSLPDDFVVKYLAADSSNFVNCPLVFSNGNLMSPSKFHNYRPSPVTITDQKSLPLSDLTCINSGLMISVAFYNQIGGYNPNLFLDFCDHDFIERVKKAGVTQIGIVDCKLVQDFSAVSHTKAQSLFRYGLFVKDLQEFYRGRNKFTVFTRVDLPRLLKLSYTFKTLEFVKTRLF